MSSSVLSVVSVCTCICVCVSVCVCVYDIALANENQVIADQVMYM